MRNASSFIVLALVACGGSNEPAKTPEETAAKVEQPVTPPAAAATADMPAPATATKLTMAEISAKGIAAYVDGMNAHDAKKVTALYAENAVMKSPGEPDTTGKAELEKSLAGFFAGVPDLKMAANYVFNAGDVSILQVAMTGTHKGDMGPLKATNKPVGWQAATVIWWNAEGQIKEEHLYWDVGTMMSQIGMSKQKSPAIPTLGTKTETFTAGSNPAEGKNPAALKAFYGAFEAKKTTDFTGMMTETTEWTDNAMPAPSKGTKDAKKYFDSMRAGFPDAKMSVTNQWAVGDFVISESTFSGTNTGAFMGMKATKKPVSLQSVDIIMMKDGKIAKGWSFGNSVQAAEQLGLLPAPGAAPAAPAKAPATPAKTTPAKK